MAESRPRVPEAAQPEKVLVGAPDKERPDAREEPAVCPTHGLVDAVLWKGALVCPDPECHRTFSSVGVSGSASDEAREPEFVYAASREEAERLLDNSYLTKYRAVPVSKREMTFWTGFIVGYFAALFLAILVVTVNVHG